MKVDINESAEKKFEPFSFTVTVETPQEARTWFHVFNCAGLKALFTTTEPYWTRSYSGDIATSFEPSMKVKDFIRGRVTI